MKKILLISSIILAGVLFTPCTAQSYVDFDSLSSGMTSPGAYVLSLYINDSIQSAPLFAGGHFTIAGRNAAANIAEWIDSIPFNFDDPTTPLGKWVPLATGVNNDVCALTMWNNDLYAGGKFDTAGGIAASHIARWDTAAQKWDSLMGQLNGNVYALCVYHDTLYVGGDFTLANGNVVNRIARWTGSTWLNVSYGFDTGAVYALTVSNDTLYAGGSFLRSGDTILNHIAKLNGSLWKPVGTGTNNTVYALTDWDNALYAGGAFTKSGGITTKYISRFDNYYTNTWDSLNIGLNDTVRALNPGFMPVASLIKPPGLRNTWTNTNLLLIGGNFDSAYDRVDKYLALYGLFSYDTVSLLNGSGPVYAIALQDPFSNYAAGNFINAKDHLSNIETLNNVAILNFNIGGGGGVQNLSNHSNITVYPNPGNGIFTLVIAGEAKPVRTVQPGGQSPFTIEIYNMLGEKVSSNYQITKSSNYQIDLTNQPNGVYFYRVITENGELIGDGKLIITR